MTRWFQKSNKNRHSLSPKRFQKSSQLESTPLLYLEHSKLGLQVFTSVEFRHELHRKREPCFSRDPGVVSTDVRLWAFVRARWHIILSSRMVQYLIQICCHNEKSSVLIIYWYINTFCEYLITVSKWKDSIMCQCCGIVHNKLWKPPTANNISKPSQMLWHWAQQIVKTSNH